ncbi:MAG: T9SS type A sorting domain-containing protein [Bacteroidota bacterium]
MKKLIILLLVSGLYLFANAQSLVPEVLAGAGSFADANEINLQWTVGETAVDHYYNSSYTLTAGLVQFVKLNGNCDCEYTATIEIKGQAIEVVVYPNPASHKININLRPFVRSLKATLVDSMGKIINSVELANELTQLDTGGLPNGLYFLTVTDGWQYFLTEKINVIR